MSTIKLAVQNDQDDEDEIEDDEDDFDSMDQSHEVYDDEEEDENDSKTGDGRQSGDTSKNGHFFVWKLKSTGDDTSFGNKLLRQSDNDNSDEDVDPNASDYSTDSSDEEESQSGDDEEFYGGGDSD